MRFLLQNKFHNRTDAILHACDSDNTCCPHFVSIEHVIDRIAQTVKREFDVHLPQYVLNGNRSIFYMFFRLRSYCRQSLWAKLFFEWFSCLVTLVVEQLLSRSAYKNLDFCAAYATERLFSLFSLIFELFLPCHQFEKLQKLTDVGARLQVHNGVKVFQKSKNFHVFLHQ